MSTTAERGDLGSHERVTIRLSTAQVVALEGLVDGGEFPNRSEAIRAGVGAILEGCETGD